MRPGKENDVRSPEAHKAVATPSRVTGSGPLDPLAETACSDAPAATAEATQRAYAADWRHYTRWCRHRGTDPLPPSPRLIGFYLADLVSPSEGGAARSVATIERRLSGLVWNYAQRGVILDRRDRHIGTVIAGLRRRYACPRVQKEAILAEEILAMAGTLPRDLRGLRDRAILLVGFAGGLRRSEIVGLDIGKDMARGNRPGFRGWIEIMKEGAVLTLGAKRRWREVAIGRGSCERSCPVHALETWLHFSRIASGPVFVRTSRDGTRALEARLSDKHVVRLVKQTVLAAGLRPDLSETDRLALFSAHSLRAAFAVSAESGDGQT